MATQTAGQKSSSKLPNPQDRPGADVVIYDGQCKICTSGVSVLHRLDVNRRLAFLSLHDPQVGQVAPNLTHDQMMEEMWVIDPNGRQYGGAEGFRYLTRRLGLLWPAMPLLHIPGSLPVWKWGYRRFASIRYRFGRIAGEDCGDSCQVHFGPRAPKQE